MKHFETYLKTIRIDVEDNKTVLRDESIDPVGECDKFHTWIETNVWCEVEERVVELTVEQIEQLAGMMEGKLKSHLDYLERSKDWKENALKIIT